VIGWNLRLRLPDKARMVCRYRKVTLFLLILKWDFGHFMQKPYWKVTPFLTNWMQDTTFLHVTNSSRLSIYLIWN